MFQLARKPLRKVVLILFISLLLLTLSQVFAADITVNDSCTLAQAITSANTDATADGSSCTAGSGSDTIVLSADITLAQALPQITSEIQIKGEGYTISGADSYRVLAVGTNGDLTVRNAIITAGAADNGGAIAVDSGSLSIADSAISNSAASQNGGAIAVASGAVIITNTTFSGNSAGQDGGAVSVSSGVVVITNSSYAGNSAGQDGGAVAISGGIVTITSSSYAGNSATGSGGAIYNGANLTIQNSTLAANSASNGSGGAFQAAGGISTLTHLTFFANSAPDATDTTEASGAALHVQQGAVHLRNSILYGSSSGDDCVGTLAQDAGNLIGSGNCSATAITDNPRLEDLTGSPSHYPLNGDSPAIDAASSDFCTAIDQIGTPRPQDSACDIGAFEYIPPLPVQAQQVQAEAEETEEATRAPTPTPTPTPEPTRPPSTCSTSLPAGIVVSGFHGSTQCQQLSGGGIGLPDFEYIDAVDVWGYVLPGTQVCFRQTSGRFIFLDAAMSPRAASELTQVYRISDGTSEMLCAQIDRAGSVVLAPETE